MGELGWGWVCRGVGVVKLNLRTRTWVGRQKGGCEHSMLDWFIVWRVNDIVACLVCA